MLDYISHKLPLGPICYGVATVSRIDKIIGLFCSIASLLYVSFAKETICSTGNLEGDIHTHKEREKQSEKKRERKRKNGRLYI